MLDIVLCIDRDDDIGRKTGLHGPFIGRDINLKVANALGLSDPEDSDTNAIFGAISTYDSLKNEGKDVEVVTICGDVAVGIKSDSIISEQLDSVFSQLKPSGIILVSDGVEDEFIMPLITSRVTVKHLRRIIVRQSKNLESSYYIFIKALQDEKISRKIIIPFALIFLGFSASIIFILAYAILYPSARLPNPDTFALSVITLVLGAYLLIRGFKLGTVIKNYLHSARENFVEAKFSYVANIISILLIIEGIIYSYQQTVVTKQFEYKALIFLRTLVLWTFAAVLVREGGTAFDSWFGTHKLQSGFWVATITLVGLTLAIYGTLDFFAVQLGFEATQYSIIAIIIIVLGLVLVLFAGLMRRMFKYYQSIRAEEAEDNEVQ
jgi:putative membrane protein